MPGQNKFSLFSSPTSLGDRIRQSVVVVHTITPLFTKPYCTTFLRLQSPSVQSAPRKPSHGSVLVDDRRPAPPVDSLEGYGYFLLSATGEIDTFKYHTGTLWKPKQASRRHTASINHRMTSRAGLGLNK